MANFFKPQAKKTHLNKTTTIDIQRLDMNGDGVGHWHNKPVFVAGVLPTETVEVKIIEEKAKYFRGKAQKVSKVSALREKPRCAHFYQCGGCDLQHMQEEQQLAFKQQKVADLFRRNAQLESLPWCEPLTSAPWHYRRKARIGVQYNKLNESIIGFRRKNSNTLTDIKQCPILPEIFSSEFAEFKQLIDGFKTKRAISHIEVIDADQPRVIFRELNSLSKTDRQTVQRFSQNKPYQLILQNDQGLKTLSGSAPEMLSYQVNNCQLNFAESDFVQVNEQLNQVMIDQAIDWLSLSPEDRVADLFCGLGNFSLPMAKKVDALIGVEGVEEMVKRAEHNAALNALTNTHFFQADLNAEKAQWPWWDSKTNKVLIDPARAGALNAVKNIADTKVKTLLYISCDPATMSRDAGVLLGAGFTLQKLAIMDMFAQTRHVEAMGLFIRQ